MPASIGERIREARLSAGFHRPEDVSAATGGKISKTFIYQIERIGSRGDQANPTLDTLILLADLYRVGLGEFFEPVGVSIGELLELGAAIEPLPPEQRRQFLRHLVFATNTILANWGRETPATITPTSEEVAKEGDRPTIPVGLLRRPTSGEPQEKRPKKRSKKKRRGRTDGPAPRSPRRPPGDEGES